MQRIGYVGFILAFVLISVWASAAETPAPEAPAESAPVEGEPGAEAPAAEEPKIVVAETKRMKIDVDLSGVFEARKMTPVSLEPKVWSDLRVERAVAPGTVVKKGDQLLWLRMEEVDRQIADIEADDGLAKLALKQATEELRLLEITNPMELTRADRSKRIADEEYQDYVELVLGYQDKYLALDEDGMKLQLEGAQEEMRQLERMYLEDEMMEDVEYMVLKRNRYHLRRALVNHEIAEKRFALRPKQDLKRIREDKEHGHRMAELAWEKAKISLPMQLEQKRMQIAKMLRDRERAVEKLADLKADREAITVRAPADGIVYYGQCVRGQWPTAAAADAKLQKGGRLGSLEVFMTIVDPDEMFIRAGVPEKDLHDLRAGSAVKVTPTGYPKSKLAGTVTAVAIRPPGPGQFSVLVDVDGDVSPLMPGMTCSLKVAAYDKADALVVPASAVFSEDDDEDSRYVYLQRESADPLKRSVTVGRQKGDDLEILTGLAAGDAVLAEKPADEK